jgi:hypothetical protein
MSLSSLRARLEALAGRMPTPPTEWRPVEFPIMDPGPTGPVHTSTLIRDTSAPAGWREIAPNTEQNTKGNTT